MAIEAKEIIIYIRKGLSFSIRTSYRCACDHPVVLGMVFLMLMVYRSFPALFAFLVSSSPVIVCTALLLGALLSYGELNIPEIEEQEKKTQEISHLKVGSAVDDLVVKEDESFTVDNHVASRKETKESTVKEAVLGETSASTGSEAVRDVPFSKMLDEGDHVGNTSLVESSVGEDKIDNNIGTKSTEEAGIQNQGFVQKREFSIEQLDEGAWILGEDGGSVSTKEQKEVEGLKVDSVMPVLENHFDSSLGSPWQPIDSHDASSDSESDRAESSSPDASMADIIPMLDELHPLLDSEHPQPALRSVDNSDAASSGSSQDHELDEGSAGEEGEDKEDKEKEVRKEKDDANEVVVTWTADDQKNVMDLGISELERNQRLENLIAKRRAKKLQRFETEKNLIDLDVHYPVSTLEELSHFLGGIPAISAPRRNPFDLPYDSEGSMSLRHIPGSAPSVLQPRQNPFDLPYDQVEESNSLTGENSSRHEFVSVPQRDMFYGRHENFSSGASFSGDFRQQEEPISKLDPYFASESTGFAAFQGQLSEKSELNLSSAPESDTVSSATGQEDHKKELLEPEPHLERILLAPANRDAEPVEQDSKPCEEVESVDAKHEERGIDVSDDPIIDLNTSAVVEETHQAADAFDSVGQEVREVELNLSSSVAYLESEFLAPTAPAHHDAEPVEQDGKSFEETESVDVKHEESGIAVADDPIVDLNTSIMVEETHQATNAFDSVGQEVREVEVLSSNSILNLESKLLPQAHCGDEPGELFSQSFEEVDSVDAKHENSWMDLRDDPPMDLNTTNAVVDAHQAADAFGSVEQHIGEGICSPISDAGKLETIEEKYEESSFSVSEENEKNLEMSILEQSASLEQTRESFSYSPPGSMQSIHADSGLLRIATERDDNGQVEDPLYDSSPSTIAKSLSNISTLDDQSVCYPGKEAFEHSSLFTSDVDGDISEVASPPRLLGKQISAEDRDIAGAEGTTIEDLASDSGWVASASLSSLAENEQKSRELIEIREPDAIQVGFSDIPVMPESACQIMHPPSLPLVYTDSNEGSVINVGESLHSGAEKMIDAPPFTEESANQPPSEASLEESQVSILDLAPMPEENLEDNKLEEEQESMIEPPATLGLTGLHIIEESDVGFPDIDQHLSSLQASAEETCRTGNTELLVPVPENVGDLTGLRLFEPVDTKSELEIESYNYPSDSQGDIISEVHSRKEGCFLKNLNDSDEESDEVHAEVREIRGIDEGLLSELDAVGDFQVELKSDQGNPEEEVQSGDQSFSLGVNSSTETPDLPSQLQVSGDRSIEDANISLGLPSQASVSNSEKLHPVGDEPNESEVEASLTAYGKDPEMTGYDSELPVLDACSLEELGSVSKQLHEEAVVPSVSDLVVGMQITSKSEVGSSRLESMDRELELTDSELVVLEAKSVDDISSVLKQLSEGDTDKATHKAPKQTATDTELLVLEAKSIEDLSLVLKQQSEGDTGKTTFPEVEPSEMGSHLEPMGSISDMHVVEAKSLEDIGLALKQHSEGTLENPLNPADHNDGFPEVEASKIHLEPETSKLQSAEEIGFGFKEVEARKSSVVVEQGAENLEECAAKADVSSSSASASRKIWKKEKSDKPGSSSSSCSSSSPSDSE